MVELDGDVGSLIHVALDAYILPNVSILTIETVGRDILCEPLLMVDAQPRPPILHVLKLSIDGPLTGLTGFQPVQVYFIYSQGRTQRRYWIVP